MGFSSDTFVSKVDNVFILIVGISVALLILVTFFMVFFVIRYNKNRNPDPQEIEGNILLEILWTVIPTALVLLMFYYGWTDFRFVRDIPENAMTVKVTGRMWSWAFEYENGIVNDTLDVPVGTPVKLALHSQDVIHSLYIPAFRIKEDAVPGMETHLWFSPDELGSYDIFCAEYCGRGHSSMLSKVNALAENDFREWYSGKAAGIVAVAKKNKEPTPDGSVLVKTKGCIGCHSLDGTKIVGPSFKGIYGKKAVVITEGKERQVIMDEEYLRRSILTPGADIVKGYPPIMPPQKGALSSSEIQAIIEYIKTLQ